MFVLAGSFCIPCGSADRILLYLYDEAARFTPRNLHPIPSRHRAASQPTAPIPSTQITAQYMHMLTHSSGRERVNHCTAVRVSQVLARFFFSFFPLLLLLFLLHDFAPTSPRNQQLEPARASADSDSAAKTPSCLQKRFRTARAAWPVPPPPHNRDTDTEALARVYTAEDVLGLRNRRPMHAPHTPADHPQCWATLCAPSTGALVTQESGRLQRVASHSLPGRWPRGHGGWCVVTAPAHSSVARARRSRPPGVLGPVGYTRIHSCRACPRAQTRLGPGAAALAISNGRRARLCAGLSLLRDTELVPNLQLKVNLPPCNLNYL